MITVTEGTPQVSVRLTSTHEDAYRHGADKVHAGVVVWQFSSKQASGSEEQAVHHIALAAVERQLNAYDFGMHTLIR